MLSWIWKRQREPETTAEIEETKPKVPLLDHSVVDCLFANMRMEQSVVLVDRYFIEFDRHVRQLHDACLIGDHDLGLNAVYILTRISAGCGAVAMTEHVSQAKYAYLAEDFAVLSKIMLQLVDLQRDSRSALMIHLAKLAATQMATRKSLAGLH